MRNIHFLILMISIHLLAACTTTGNVPDKQPVDEIEITAPPTSVDKPGERDANVEYQMKPVVLSLLKKAGQRMAAEDYVSAANYLERGISIEPNNPMLWQQLATVRLKQGDFYQAEQLAVKSNVLGESDNQLRLKNWKIIAEAKKLQQSSAP